MSRSVGGLRLLFWRAQMRSTLTAAITALMLTGLAATSHAQDLGGYLTAGSGAIDYLVVRDAIPQISGGVLVRFADDRVRVGAQADVFFSNGYVSGRGGPLAEIALLSTRHRVQPFATGGYYFGEGGGLVMYGGGVDLWMTDQIGIRAGVQDAVRHLSFISPFDFGRSSAFSHEPSVQFGVVWR
jgi:hypothetical protein